MTGNNTRVPKVFCFWFISAFQKTDLDLKTQYHHTVSKYHSHVLNGDDVNKQTDEQEKQNYSIK